MWPARVGIHPGEAQERNRDDDGPSVHTAAPVPSVGHGGQVLVTEIVRSVAGPDASDPGSRELRGVAEPVRAGWWGRTAAIAHVARHVARAGPSMSTASQCG